MAHERGREGSSSPMQAAEPSQQLGLSPGAGEQEAMAASAGGQPEAAGSLEPPADPSLAIVAAAAPTPAPATTPAPLLHGVAAAAPEAQRAPRLLSGMAAEWQDLLDWAAELVRELEATDRLHPTFRPNPYLPAEEEQDAHYEDVVSCPVWLSLAREWRPSLLQGCVAPHACLPHLGPTLSPPACSPLTGLILACCSTITTWRAWQTSCRRPTGAWQCRWWPPGVRARSLLDPAAWLRPVCINGLIGCWHANTQSMLAFSAGLRMAWVAATGWHQTLWDREWRCRGRL